MGSGILLSSSYLNQNAVLTFPDAVPPATPIRNGFHLACDDGSENVLSSSRSTSNPEESLLCPFCTIGMLAKPSLTATPKFSPLRKPFSEAFIGNSGESLGTASEHSKLVTGAGAEVLCVSTCWCPPEILDDPSSKLAAISLAIFKLVKPSADGDGGGEKRPPREALTGTGELGAEAKKKGRLWFSRASVEMEGCISKNTTRLLLEQISCSSRL